MVIGPAFEEIELTFSWTARQDMATALQDQCAIIIETDGAIGAIQLFFNHQVAISSREAAPY
jgi:hypothetical protein